MVLIEQSRLIDAHSGAIHVVKFNTNGNYVLSGGQDRTVKLWNPRTKKLISSYHLHNREVLDLSISYDGEKFASVGGDTTAFLWDVSSGKTVARFSGHLARINSVSFSADASIIATGSFDTTVKVWDCRSRGTKPIQTFDDAKDSVSSVIVSTTEPQIISGSVDGRLRFYDVRNGQLTTDVVGHPITDVVESRSGQAILVSTLDSSIRLFNRADGSMVKKFQGHKNSQLKLNGLAFFDQDSRVVSASEDGYICIWDMNGSLERVKTASHAIGAKAFALGSNSRNELASSTTSGDIQVWKLS
ncbi:hypothetical protein TRVA0_001S08724 [Trichomonascus vanleenenianus]|uniref:WD40 repeat domain-containing protein n=1 Tax=Trichomonascus vanleenenianus TaxID=2268995 RepID=UPI003EC9F8EE